MLIKEINENCGSVFASLEVLPPDLGLERLPEEYNADQHANKVSLGAGVYRTDEGESWLLPAVKEVLLAVKEALIVGREKDIKESLL
jgi:aspartate aminotransferase, cytoplasmic